MKIIESALLSFIGATIIFLVPSIFSSACQRPPIGLNDPTEDTVVRYTCPVKGDQNPLASLLFTTEGNTVKFFLTSFQEGAGFNVYVAIVFFLLWFFFCAIEYGIAVPAGLFFPGLLIGASLGQFVGLFIFNIGIISEAKMLASINVYATIGGVAVLTGYT